MIWQFYRYVFTALIFLILKHIIALEQINHLARINLTLVIFIDLISLVLYLCFDYLVI